MTECHGNNKGPMSPPQTPTDLSFILNPTESSTKKEETTATPNSITSIPVTPANTTVPSFQAPVRTVLGARYLLNDLPESIRILLREDDDQTHQPSLQQKRQQQQQQHQHHHQHQHHQYHQQHHQHQHQHQQQHQQHQHHQHHHQLCTLSHAVRRRPDCGGRRKNPYPMRSPSKQPTKGLPPTPPTTTVYGLYNEDPRGFLERNLKELKFIEDPRPHSPRPILSDEERELEQEQKKLSRRRTKKKRPIPYDKVQRKKKSNSMARVLADRASISVTSSHTLSDHSTNTTSSPQSENGETCNEGITSTSTRESATVRVSKAPAPPAMEWHDLKAAIDNLGLDQVRINVPNHGITWKGSPLNITTLPHYSSMHPSEASVASVLRLTPLQYFNAKYTLVSTANRYVQREQPFRKSDAQKLLHIDVNKASKLWEFFVLAGWIKADERDIMRRK
ncbi:9799_t:CDS:2 [Paraglomus occultum]|uniref:9799_t:CDS:1 n=1 Tax=Paraglomus occultum TaxID=144539 RepID=A0A9N9AW42_9GLOM|nr:9799_t:CDS:2 [Paraglomus occultum]